ncbi:MAG TPA: hypothetical protein VEH76_02000 [Methylocystis sp.]|nr:hypothetical protein [Methylocystis sp.]
MSKIQKFSEVAKLRQTVKRAKTLGLVMREIGRWNDFKYAYATRFIADVLIAWAHMVENRLQEESDVFFDRPLRRRTH